jgi:arsenate reductase
LPVSKPVILFACVHNSGRSVAAKVLTEHYAGEAVVVRSAGSAPSGGVNPAIAVVLAERGLSTDAEVPTLLDHAMLEGCDVVITMGCGETCPVVAGKHYEDWPVADPKGQDLDTVRAIVADIDSRVRALLSTLPATNVEIGSTRSSLG